MYTNIKRRPLALILGLMLFLSAVIPAQAAFISGGVHSAKAASQLAGAPAATDTDKTNVITNLTATVKQGGVAIDNTAPINSKAPIRVQVSFGVPVFGDLDTTNGYVEKGDTASIKIGTGFTVTEGSILLYDKVHNLVGTAYLTTVVNSVTGAKEVWAEVVFDGDDKVFDGTVNSVTVEFGADLTYDASGSNGDVGTHNVQILTKDFTVVVPPATIDYNMVKRGTLDSTDSNGETIVWEVEITAAQGGFPIDLADRIFSDNLAAVGTYVPGSFGVFATDTDLADQSKVSYDAGSKVLSYTFPNGSMSPQTVKFKTHILDNKYYSTSSQDITNTAQLKSDATTVLKQATKTVPFTPPKWIQKAGAVGNSGDGSVYDPRNRTITWTITVNPQKQRLTNVAIVDALPGGLTWDSAKWQTSSDGSTWTDAGAATPSGNTYTFSGPTSDMLRLVIVSKVVATATTTDITTYTNSATVTWEGLPVGPIGSGNVGVGVGYDGLTKTGKIQSYENRTIRWKVTVDPKGQNISDLTVYDLLVYGKSASFNIDTVTGIPAGIDKTKLTPRYGQKYELSSFFGAGLSIVVIPVLQDGTRVADLLKVTGLDSNNSSTFEFDSQVVDPDIFAGNTTSTVSNTASLFSGDTYLRSATDDVNYVSKLLAKEMLNRAAMADPAAGVNTQRTTALTDGFDYQEKAVIFRLSINADKLDFSTIRNATDSAPALGKGIVTDTLPVGWKFVPFAPGQDYLIFAGNKDSSPSSSTGVTATGSPIPVAGLSYDITPQTSTKGETITFTFDPLDTAYVILVKAMPADTKMQEYFSKNHTSNATNDLVLKAENWDTGVSKNQTVQIESTVLSKSNDTPTDGTLRWTVVYNPYSLPNVGTRIEDKLPEGLDLRTDAMGALLLGSNITAYEMILQPNGTLVEGAPVTLVLGSGGNISYDNTERVLSFTIPDSQKAYRLTYLTDITGDPGKVYNEVKLLNSDDNVQGAAIPYTITAADGFATMERGGLLAVKKVNAGNSDSALQGAAFTLYADGYTPGGLNNIVIRTATSDASGMLLMKALPVGFYWLVETGVPGGFTPATAYRVEITAGYKTQVGGSAVTRTDPLVVKNFPVGTASLTIQKRVLGETSSSKSFEFTIELTNGSGSPLTGELFDTVRNGAPGAQIKHGDTFTLAHGDSLTILGLPTGTQYKVTEKNYEAEGYFVDSAGYVRTGIAASNTVIFTNTKDVKGLLLSKTVVGGPSSGQKFRFKVEFTGVPAGASYSYEGHNGAANGTITSGGYVELAHGEYIVIEELPVNARYKITEDDYYTAGYKTEPVDRIMEGDIRKNAPAIVSFQNTWYLDAGLEIHKTVQGSTEDKAKEFEFTLTLAGPDVRDNVSYAYTGINGGPSGSFTGKTGTVKLTDGQGIFLTGLPRGTSYTVTEADYSKDGFVTFADGKYQRTVSGAIQAGEVKTAAFTNTKRSDDGPTTGSLRIQKTVYGEHADLNRQFTFVVNLEAKGRFSYSGSKSGTIENGQKITLAHGEYIVISGLPLGSGYQVTEVDANRGGYYTTSVDASGAIAYSRTAAFYNAMGDLPKTGGEPSHSAIVLMLSSLAFALLAYNGRRKRSGK